MGRLHEAIPGSTFRMLTDSGHFTMLDRPAELAVELQAHLTRAETTPIARLVDRVSDAVTGLVDPH